MTDVPVIARIRTVDDGGNALAPIHDRHGMGQVDRVVAPRGVTRRRRRYYRAWPRTRRAGILADWSGQQRHFVKVMPRDYKRVLQAIAEAERDGVDVDKAIMAAAHG